MTDISYGGKKFSEWKIDGLKQELRLHNKKISGNKRELFDRLFERKSKRSSKDYKNLSVADLKQKLKSMGLKVSGKKSELIDRLNGGNKTHGRRVRRGSKQSVKKEPRRRSSSRDSGRRSSIKNYSKLKVDELKDLLRKKGLKVSGKKSELIERLGGKGGGGGRAGTNKKPQDTRTSQRVSSRDYSKLKVNELKDVLRKKGLKVSGKKSELLERLGAKSSDRPEGGSRRKGGGGGGKSERPRRRAKDYPYESAKYDIKNLMECDDATFLTIAQNFGINTVATKSREDIVDEIINEIALIDTNEYLDRMISTEDIPDKLQTQYIYLKGLTRDDIITICKHLKIKTNQSSAKLVLDIIMYIKKNKFKISVETLQGLTDPDTSIIKVNDKAEDIKNGKYNYLDRTSLSSINNKDVRLTSKQSCITQSGVPLTEYQDKAVKCILKNRGTLLYFETGTGKTLTAVTAAMCYLKERPDGEVVVITPTSLKQNFKKEMDKYGVGPESASKFVFYTYDEIVNKIDADPSYIRFAKDKFLIIDEVHKLRTDIKTKKSTHEGKQYLDIKAGKKALMFIKASKRAHKVLVLTATPFYNSVDDGKNILELLEDGHVGVKTERDVIRRLADHTIYQGTMNDADFPAVEEEYIMLKMDPKYYANYKQVEQENHHSYSSPWIFLNGVRRAMNKIGDESSSKIDKVVDLVSEAVDDGEKCLIFSNWLAAGVSLLVSELEKIEGANIGIITGSVSAKRRASIVEQYNKRELNVLIVSSAGGEGLDLKETSKCIVLDALWSDAAFQQIKGRAVRKQSHANLPLNKRKVKIYYLCMIKPVREETPSADEIMKHLVKEKTARLNRALQELQQYSLTGCSTAPFVRKSVHDVPVAGISSAMNRDSIQLSLGSEAQAKANARRNTFIE